MADTTESACSDCGAPITRTTSYIAEKGPICRACFDLLTSRQKQANRDAESIDASLSRSAKRLGAAHSMWAFSAVLAAQWAPLPSWLASLLLVAAVVLVAGLILRWRSAFVVAIGLDAAGALAFIVGGALRSSGPARLIALGALFPLSLFGLCRWLRTAYEDKNPDGLQVSSAFARWLVPAVTIVALGVLTAQRFSRPKIDPARALMQRLLPDWQSARARGAGQPETRAMLDGAHRWPALATGFEALERAWPSDAPMREAAKTINRALADVGLPYFTDVWPVGRLPIVLSYELTARVPWRIGARTVEVARLRRLDAINVEFEFLGTTEPGQPVVRLDRVEMELAEDLPAMYGKGARPDQAALNDFDRLVLAKYRAFFEARLGAGIAEVASALGERDRRLEEMRGRLHGGEVQLSAPDGFVLGETWLDTLDPLAELTHAGGRLILDTDLKQVVSADEKLRDPTTTRTLADALDLMATETEAHEIRHAVDDAPREAPPPPQLFEVMPASSASMIAMADRELRAYLGELHDSPAPACVTLASCMRLVAGGGARATPHYFATRAILSQLSTDTNAEPPATLAALCALPDDVLRARVATAWQTLYGEPMEPGVRQTPLRASPSF